MKIPFWGGISNIASYLDGFWIGIDNLNDTDLNNLENLLLETIKTTTSITEELPEQKKIKGEFWEKLNDDYYFFERLKRPKEKENPNRRYGKSEVASIEKKGRTIFLRFGNKPRSFKEDLEEKLRVQLGNAGFTYSKKVPLEYKLSGPAKSKNKEKIDVKVKETPIFDKPENLEDKKIKKNNKNDIKLSKPPRKKGKVLTILKTALTAGIIGGIGGSVYLFNENYQKTKELENRIIKLEKQNINDLTIENKKTDNKVVLIKPSQNYEKINQLELLINDYQTQLNTIRNNIQTQEETIIKLSNKTILLDSLNGELNQLKTDFQKYKLEVKTNYLSNSQNMNEMTQTIKDFEKKFSKDIDYLNKITLKKPFHK